MRRALPVMLCVTATAMLCALEAGAQDGGLRGMLDGGGANSAALGLRGAQSQPAGQPEQDVAQQYDPISPGAVPDDQPAASDANDSLFSLPSNADDTFGDEPVPDSTRTPSTARQRIAARNASDIEPVRENLRVETVDQDINTPALRAPTIDTMENPEIDQRAEREQAIEGLRRPHDDHPFAPVGIRVGSFILRPSLEQGLTATSNASISHDGSSAVLSETTLRLNAVSDWSRHSAAIEAYGNLRRTLSGEKIRDSEIGVNARLDLDLGNELHGFGTLGYLRRPESASSPVTIVGTLSQPIRQTVSGGLGLEKDVGKARFGIAGRLEHDMYGAAELSGGGTVSQKDRDSTLASLTLRGGYEISPALTPFVEAELGRRFYDQKVDANGYERSGNIVGARAGLALDMGEKLSGEFSAGWLRESFDDDRLRPISGPSIATTMVWSPERGTVINLVGTSTAEGSTTAGESGSLLHSLRLSAEREVRADLTANAALGFGYRDYMGSDGHDRIFSAEAGATWWLNRSAGLTGRLRHERMRSNLPYRDYDANSVFLGLTVQR